MAGITRDAGSFTQPVRGDSRCFRLGATVHPDQAGGKRPSVAAGRDAAIELAGDAESRDLVFWNPGAGERLGDGRADRGIPQRRILLGPARTGIVRFIGSRGFAKETKFLVEDDGLETLGADIDADDGDGLISRGSGASGQNIA